MISEGEEVNYPNNIAMVRRMRGLSQAAVAQAIGVSRPKYIEIEKGSKELTISQMEKLMQVLDVEFEDLIGIDTGRFDFRKILRQCTPDSTQENTENGARDDVPSAADARKKPKTSNLAGAHEGAKSAPGAVDANGTPGAPQIFEGKTIRSAWDEDAEKWWFSVVDVVGVLTDQPTQRGATLYWAKLKERLKVEGAGQLLTVCQQLKLQAADGKMRKTDVMNTEQIFRLIQSIPSKKAEPFKRWLAKVGAERIEETVDPELSINRAIESYRRKGYTEEWINRRVQSIRARKDLTDQWDKHGVKRGKEYAVLTDDITEAWSGLTTRKYKNLKGLKKENLRDNMSMLELTLNQLAELATAELTDVKNPQGLHENRKVAKEGGAVAGNARREIETQTGRPVVTSKTAAELGFVVTNLLDAADEFADPEAPPGASNSQS